MAVFGCWCCRTCAGCVDVSQLVEDGLSIHGISLGWDLPRSTLCLLAENIVQLVDAAEGTKIGLEVVDHGTWSVCVGSINPKTGSEMDVMVYGRLVLTRVSEVRLLEMWV